MLDLKKYLTSFKSVVYLYETCEDANWGDVESGMCEDVIYHIPCRVDDVILETFYFEEKRESIYIKLNLSPIEDEETLMQKYAITRDEYESVFIDVPLENILKY